MRVMVIVKASKDSEAGVMPAEELLAAMGNYNEELVKAGIMLDGAGLKPSSQGARVHFSDSDRIVMNGPFAETKELIAGFWIWKVNSLQEAIDWVKRCPNPMLEPSDIEIRPIFESEDFGDEFTPELREQEAAVMAASMGLNFPKFEDGRDLTIFGINRNYTPDTRIAIPQQWEQFVSLLRSRMPNALNATMYGVSWNTKADCSFDYLTGFESSIEETIPNDLEAIRIPPHRYAVFAHTTHVSAMPKTFDLIWSRWAPACGLKIADAPCLERYTQEFDAQSGMGGMEIWIPLATLDSPS